MSRDGGGILCIGRVYCDLIFSGLPAMPAMGREVFAEALDLHAGGGAYITAAYVAALGRPAHLFATLPAAPFDAVVAREIAANGIRAGLSAVAAAGDPQVTVALSGAADRAFLTRRSGPAFPEGLAAALALPGLAHLHIGELTTLIEAPDLPARARAAGLSVSLDCGWDAAAFARGDLAALIGAVDVFLPNADEAAQLEAQGLGPRPAPLTVVKRGAAGAVARPAAGAEVAVPAGPVRVLDTTGAGDAFNAGFLHSWLAGRPLAEALALGNACGAVAVGRLGGAGPLPRLDHLPGRAAAAG